MMNLASRTGSLLAVSAAAISIVLASFVPYGHPWASLSWAVLACAAAVWAAQSSSRPTPQMSDVIRNVEAEPPRIPVAMARGMASRGAIS